MKHLSRRTAVIIEVVLFFLTVIFIPMMIIRSAPPPLSPGFVTDNSLVKAAVHEAVQAYLLERTGVEWDTNDSLPLSFNAVMSSATLIYFVVETPEIESTVLVIYRVSESNAEITSIVADIQQEKWIGNKELP